MDTKPCQKCGTAARYASGVCKKCSYEKLKRYRAKLRGDTRIPEPVPAYTVPAEAPEYEEEVPLLPPVLLSDAFGTSTQRLNYVIRRLETIMRQLDDQGKRIDRLRAAATSVTDIRFYFVEKRKLLQATMRFNERLAKDLRIYSEMDNARSDKETPITINVPGQNWQEVVLGSMANAGNPLKYVPVEATREFVESGDISGLVCQTNRLLTAGDN